MAKQPQQIKDNLTNLFARTDTPQSGQSSQPQPPQSQPGQRRALRQTEPAPEPEPEIEQPVSDHAEPTRPLGVAMTLSEADFLTHAAKALGLSRHALMQWIIRDFIARWEAGDRPKTEMRAVLKK